MKQKRKTSLSPLQRKRLLRISLCILGAVFLWIVFAPGRGLFFLHQQKKHLAALAEQTEALIIKNKELAEGVERLQNDEGYLEQVAREEHGMLKKNEMVFDFAKEKKKK
ncbi:MAG: septum formation initiator family protein [Proteobacteria bacterium]|nr:septum formation initiator family protein [Pseudomonadota bacterium]MBU1417798.1 septum formation initiator family protein [Pseudomonadota bacterium]MBU1453674.1 septum formation initiator family protein [Pseudomonadota bacterium]